jgi:hypothetical protein
MCYKVWFSLAYLKQRFEVSFKCTDLQTRNSLRDCEIASPRYQNRDDVARNYAEAQSRSSCHLCYA